MEARGLTTFTAGPKSKPSRFEERQLTLEAGHLDKRHGPRDAVEHARLRVGRLILAQEELWSSTVKTSPGSRRRARSVRRRGSSCPPTDKPAHHPHPILCVDENIELPLSSRVGDPTQIRARLDPTLTSSPLRPRRPGGTVSHVRGTGGIAIDPGAAAAVFWPTDLPVSSTFNGRSVLDLLGSLKARESASILTVTHNPVADGPTRRLVMRDARSSMGLKSPAIEAREVKLSTALGTRGRGVDSGVQLAAAGAGWDR